MFVRVKDKANGKKAIQIVETYRRGDKVSQKIVRHIGQAVAAAEVEALKQLAQAIMVEVENQRQPVLPLVAPEDIYGRKKHRPEVSDIVAVKNLREEQRIIEGIGDVFGTLYDDLGFGNILGSRRADARWNGILKSCVLARLANPSSKLRTASMLEQDYGITIPVEQIYRMMDRVAPRIDAVKRQVGQTTLSLFQGNVDVLFCDVTTLYFESVIADELREFGYGKDGKFKEVQVALALITTTEGLPITYELFPGNVYEGHTLITMIQALKRQYTINNVVIVADRAVFNNDNLELMDKEGVNYIVAARLKAMPKALKNQMINDDDFKATLVENELHWVKEYEHKSRRLIVSYSSQRAHKDAADRVRLIERLLKRVRNGTIKIKDVISNYGSKKYLKIGDCQVVIDQARIEADARYDGLHGVIANLKEDAAHTILTRYRGLWQIEEAFRVNKHDLKMRPIFHWTPSRIKAHIAICFIAFAIAKQAVYRLCRRQLPLSFEQLRNELLHVQATLMVDIKTRKRHILPSHTTINQKRIYQAFGIRRTEAPYCA